MEKISWVIPCNINEYNVIDAFKNLDVLDWKQSPTLKKAKVGDIVYVYISKPFQSIKYKCEILKTNKPHVTIDDSKYIVNGQNYVNYGNYMEIKLLKTYEDNLITFNDLVENGIKGRIQGPRSLSDKFIKMIEAYDTSFNTSLENMIYKEGRLVKYYGYKYERNAQLRNIAIQIHGLNCTVCNFNFEAFYGDIGREFVEIHHIKPLFINGKEHLVNPQTDLVPLCSNCHRMIHRRKYEPYSIEELKSIIKQ